MKPAAIFDALIKAAPVRMWALIGAGPAITAILIGLILIIWLGVWPSTLASERLRYLGIIALSVTGIVGIIVVTLAAARATAHGPGGIGFDIASGADTQSTQTVTQHSQTVIEKKTEITPPKVPPE